MYGTWETNRVIAFELVRNLALALACVFVITLVLLVDIKLCLLVLLTVLLTLADVFGVLYFMGVKIDTDSCICVMTVVGLCVDYSAHIAHSFSVAEGLNSQDRTSTTLVTIGPAILKRWNHHLPCPHLYWLLYILCIWSHIQGKNVLFLFGKDNKDNYIFFYRFFHFQLPLDSFMDWSCYQFCSSFSVIA
jgi:hypothetical protein